jgi:EpsI family protein
MTTRLLLTTVLLAITAGYLATAQEPEVPLSAPLSTIPLDVDEWRGRNEPAFDDEILRVLGVDAYINRTYFSDGTPWVNLYLGFYASQRQGDTMHSPLNCLPGAGWLPVKQDRATFAVPGATGGEAPITVNEFVIQKGLDRQLVLYWYQSHGRVVASEYTSKVYMVADAIRTNRTDGAMVRIVTPIVGDGVEAERVASVRARAFVEALFPHLTRTLPS